MLRGRVAITRHGAHLLHPNGKGNIQGLTRAGEIAYLECPLTVTLAAHLW